MSDKRSKCMVDKCPYFCSIDENNCYLLPFVFEGCKNYKPLEIRRSLVPCGQCGKTVLIPVTEKLCSCCRMDNAMIEAITKAAPRMEKSTEK